MLGAAHRRRTEAGRRQQVDAKIEHPQNRIKRKGQGQGQGTGAMPQTKPQGPEVNDTRYSAPGL